MQRFNAILLLLVGMTRPPGAAKKKAKKTAATGTKVAVPDEVPVADPFYTAGENKEIFDTSVWAVLDWAGHAMQQQAWEWLSTNLTGMMNQLKGNVRNDSAKRAMFEKLQENLEASGWKKRTTGCLTEWFLFLPDGPGGASLSMTKTNNAIKSASAVAGVFLTVERDDEDADLGGGDQVDEEGLEGPSRGARDDDLLPFDTRDFLNENLENVPSFVTGVTHRSLRGDQGLN
jgi:hypothetical protein